MATGVEPRGDAPISRGSPTWDNWCTSAVRIHIVQKAELRDSGPGDGERKELFLYAVQGDLEPRKLDQTGGEQIHRSGST